MSGRARPKRTPAEQQVLAPFITARGPEWVATLEELILDQARFVGMLADEDDVDATTAGDQEPPAPTRG